MKKKTHNDHGCRFCPLRFSSPIARAEHSTENHPRSGRVETPERRAEKADLRSYARPGKTLYDPPYPHNMKIVIAARGLVRMGEEVK